MVKFVLYLVESGMCLALLYIVYFLFFRKETYFNFNRLYLLGILVFALIIPVLHITFAVSEKDEIEDAFQDIGRFRSYYTDFISASDDEFGRDRYRSYEAATFEDPYFVNSTQNKRLHAFDANGEDNYIREQKYSFTKYIAFKIFIIIYLFGVLFFLIRLFVLLFWLAKTVRHNPIEYKEGYKLVLMEKEIPPFSFFNCIFVNKDAIKLNEFEQVLAHEQVHVGQMHSLDLIVAHAITVFQWFNPLVWNLQKALKTTHEYIADSKIVNQGFELFDYQSLLLSQLVSIQSVELVNNFNLISIKKRIAMMTKNKSRFSAKLKALFVIPMALITFFLFADMTVKSPILTFSNYSQAKVSNLDGIWENTDDSFGKLLLFDGNSLSVLESADKVEVIDLDIIIKDDKFQINRFGSNTEWVKYQFTGAELKIWWSDKEFSTYKKTDYKNSFDAFKPKEAEHINLPMAEYAKILDKPNLVINIYVFPDKYLIENVECKQVNLKEVLSNKFYGLNKLDLPFITARLVVDQNTEMKSVYDLYQVLREMSLLRVAYGSFPTAGASELQFHLSGLAQMLPPAEANGAVLMEEEDVKDRLIKIVPDGNLISKGVEVENYIREHSDYIASFAWNNTTKYGEYIAVIDMFYKVIYKLRNEYTTENHNLLYTDLPADLQKEARKEYPMRLSQVNTDEE